MIKLGRLPRKHDDRIPKYGAALNNAPLPPAPLTCDYTLGMPDDLGAMYNNSLGDCTIAALYHALQVWSNLTYHVPLTEPDVDILKAYEEACGYNPANPSTDQGGVEQDVLAYAMNTGLPMGAGTDRHKITAYLEIDFKNLDDVKRAIYQCALVYIGIQVPQSVMDNADDVTVPWAAANNDVIAGGHAVILIGYDLDFFYCISWGKKYKITHNFLAQYLGEAYAIADNLWFDATSKTPLGMSPQNLMTAMAQLRGDTCGEKV